MQRAEISNPPAYGAHVASCVLNDADLFTQWETELKIMSGRLTAMRQEIQSQLEARGTPGDWGFLSTQIGMFSYTGLSPRQILELKEKWHIYMVSSLSLVFTYDVQIDAPITTGPRTRWEYPCLAGC